MNMNIPGSSLQQIVDILGVKFILVNAEIVPVGMRKYDFIVTNELYANGS